MADRGADDMGGAVVDEVGGHERRRLLFIAGAHKSGTSIFHRCIRDHPEVSGFSNTGVPEDEGQLLQTVFPAARESGGMGRYGFRPGSIMTEEHPLATAGNAARLFDQWKKHWDLDREVLVEKSPPTILRARFFQKLFPAASFILLVRHPVPVSFSTKRWTGQALHELIAHWLALHEHFESEQRPHLRRLLVCRYEDFVADPARTLGRVWEFAGLDPVPLHREIRGGIDRKYFRRWSRLGLTGRGRRYQQLILHRYQARLDALAYGYELDKPPAAG